MSERGNRRKSTDASRAEEYPAPRAVRAVERRPELHAEEQLPRNARIELARFWTEAETNVSCKRSSSDLAEQLVSVSAVAQSSFQPPPDIATERLTARSIKDLDLAAIGTDGHRPKHLPVHFKPAGLRKGKSLEPRERTRRGGAIFPPEDRYIYQDAAFPWCTVGLIETEDGWGSGTMIGRRLVLTASHFVVWKKESAGWMKFTPAASGGTTPPFGHGWAERVIYWKANGRRMNDNETAFDYAVLVLDQGLGELTGYAGYRTFDEEWVDKRYWQNLGYPEDIGGGTKPSFSNSGSVSSVAEFTSQQQTAFLLGNFIDYQPGQSGGPYWGWWGDEPWPRVIGTASTLPDTPSPDTSGDNEGGGGPALSSLIGYARSHYP
jgi:V8-like Glu-specific endopeptidase